MPGRPDELLDDLLAALQFVGPGRRAHVDRLVDGRLELLERQRPVVERRRQPEPEVDQDLLARPVVLVHADDLRDGHVRLVDDQQPVRREVVEQGPRPAARVAARQMARVVLDAGAVPEFAHHLEVERRPLPQPGALERSPFGLEFTDPELHLGVDIDDRFLELVVRRDVVRGRVDVRLLAFGQELAGQRVELGDALDLVAEELDPDQGLLGRGLEFQRVAADPEPCPGQGLVVALVLEIDQMSEDGIASVLAADPELEDRRPVVHGCAQTVDAAHARDDDHVASLEEGVRGGVAKPVDLVVPRRVLLDVGIGPREVGLGLVVVEVADEVLDGVLREELAEFRVQLGGQGLVVSQDEGRLVVPGDGPGHRRGLARPGRAEQRLVPRTLGQTLAQPLDRGGLVTGGLERDDELEVGHQGSGYPVRQIQNKRSISCGRARLTQAAALASPTPAALSPDSPARSRPGLTQCGRARLTVLPSAVWRAYGSSASAGPCGFVLGPPRRA